jgi:hypothetical protein
MVRRPPPTVITNVLSIAVNAGHRIGQQAGDVLSFGEHGVEATFHARSGVAVAYRRIERARFFSPAAICSALWTIEECTSKSRSTSYSINAEATTRDPSLSK